MKKIATVELMSGLSKRRGWFSVGGMFECAA
jgi:hypothetical protein